MNTINARRVFLGFLLRISVVVFFIGMIVEILLQQRTLSVSDRHDVTKRWLEGKITALADETLGEVWHRIDEKLRSYVSLLLAPEVVVVGSTLISPEEFPRIQEAEAGPRNYWRFGPADPGVEVNFRRGLFVTSQAFAPTQQEIQEDRRRYERLFNYMIQPFPAVQKEPISPTEYSSKMLDFFGVRDLVERRVPGLSIRWVYVASTRGTFAMYPASNQSLVNYNIAVRPWYTSIMKNEPQSERLPTRFPGPSSDAPASSSGLVPFYPDYLAGGYTRTLWHRFTNGSATYMLCTDLVLEPVDPSLRNDWVDRMPPAVLGNTTLGGPIRIVKVGGIAGLSLLSLGLLFAYLGGGRFARTARRAVASNVRPRPTESADKFRPLDRWLVARTSTTSMKSETQSSTKKTERNSIGARLSTKLVQLRHDREQERSRDAKSTVSAQFDLSRLNLVSGDRAFERWEIVRSHGDWVGTCRVCGQEVSYHDHEVLIAEANIVHRIAPEPDVDLSFRPGGSLSIDLRDSIIWQSLDPHPKELDKEHALSPYPPPRVPKEVQELAFVKEILDGYRTVCEGRLEVGDCFVASRELFRGRTIKAVCTASYFERLVNAGDSEFQSLKLGKAIERILVVENKEQWKDLVARRREKLAALVSEPSLLFYVSLDKIKGKLDGIESYPDLDFALAYGQGMAILIVSKMADHGKEGNISGYVSWRGFDTSACQALFEALRDFRSPVTAASLASQG